MAKHKPKQQASPPVSAATPGPTAASSGSEPPTSAPAQPTGASVVASEPRPGEPTENAKQHVLLEKSEPEERGFTPFVLDKTILAIPLINILQKEQDELKKKQDEQAATSAGTPPGGTASVAQPPLHHVIIDLHLEYPVNGRKGARQRVKFLIEKVVQEVQGDPANEGVNEDKSAQSEQYLFCELSVQSIRLLVQRDGDPAFENPPAPHRRAIYHIWPDFRIKGLINKSISTVKADAAQRSFSAQGDDVVWAVVDSGIDAKHPHFAEHKNLDLGDTLKSKDYTVKNGGDPFLDVYGHGTHVAGVIAGWTDASEKAPVFVTSRYRDENGSVKRDQIKITTPFSGMAPRCKLLSLKVLDDDGDGAVSNIIAALEYIQEINGNGRRIRIHGVNLSVGYDFEPEWFACGQSPLCVEVDRLVKSGVVVVVAAGNTGYGKIAPKYVGLVNSAGLELTINDPGNAELAITVGSTHRDKPHIYGVSYFSSKGPTGDGRYKPDLVAPGEKIISCRSAQEVSKDGGPPITEKFKEESGTSMAAPHVSGVIAAFLSIRREYIGKAEEVKQIFTSTATDLKRTPYFQGKGLVDLMRAIQSV